MDIDNYNLDDDENPAWDGSTEPDPERPSAHHLFRTLVKILTTPVEGWKQIRRDRLTSHEISVGLFFRIIGVLSCSKFSILIYHPTASIVQVIIEALISFTSFFASFPCILILLKILLPPEVSKKFDDGYGKSMVLMVLSSLALFGIPYECLPMLDPVLVFLPIWSIYVMSKGIRFLRISRRYETRTLIFLSALTVGMPIFLGWLLSLILPSV